MISLKKSYARQLLQLALTLSLLRVDPESYLGYGWESQLALQNGDGWQLELRAAPLSDFPYSNRKALIPLIEDLLRYDRQINPSTYDVQTYLLNVQNEQISLSTAPAPPTQPSSIESNATLSIQQTQVAQTQSQTRNTTDFNVPVGSSINDLYAMRSDPFATETVSVFDQNLSDLNDYDDGINDRSGAESDEPWSLNHLYAGLPLKDEPLDIIDDHAYGLRHFADMDDELHAISTITAASTSTEYGSNVRNELYGMLRNVESPTLNLSRVIEWSNYFDDDVKTEDDVEVKVEPNATTTENATIKLKNNRIKSESEGDEDIDHGSSSLFGDSKNSTSGFSSNVELTEEESEIVEVLWKQDVDLGYTLAPPVKIGTPKELASNASAGPSFSPDDKEKLKALQELKNEKSKDEESKNDLDDEWAGINFTVDNETGEYIKLPLQLEEILQDVLHLADLANAEDQVDQILAEELKKSDYSQPSSEESSAATAAASTSTSTASNQFDQSFAFPTDKKESTNEKREENNSNTGGNSNSGAAQSEFLPFLLDPPLTDEEISADISAIINEANELDELDMMMAGPFQHPRSVAQNYVGHGNANVYHRQPSYHPHHHHQSRLSLSRAAAASMEQRRLDIASLFSPLPGMGVGMGVSDMATYSHYPPHYSYQGASSLQQHDQYAAHQHMALHNVSLADMGPNGQSVGSIGSTIPLPPQQPHYATPNLGTAVSSSMHLTNSSHESDVIGAASGYKMDHDMMYYSNTSSSELNHTTDGFINSILNDEDLLMDMGVNDGFYTMRMLEPNTTSNNSSVLNGPTNAPGSLTNNAAGLLQNTGGAATMQTTLAGTTTATGDRLDASSDSAVSSMGSERVPSLSDGEWGDAGSDSAQEYHQSKYVGPYDYSSYNGRIGDAVRHPVAQKKHQMFGKRYLQDQSNGPALPQQSAAGAGVVHQQQQQQPDMPIKYEYEPYPMHHHPSIATNLDVGMPIVSKHQSQQHQLSQQQAGEMKYSCSIDFARQATPGRGIHDIVGHNHTYTLPPATGTTPRSQTRDKKNPKKADEEHLSRDEKRARALNIPMPVNDIINLPMDEFNERLSKYDLSEAQLSLIRDIRRRGKNKVAAQNCRKRKLDQIICLADEVDQVRKRKESLLKENEAALAERKRILSKFNLLHRHIFQHLRDPQGNLYSESDYNLQLSADGGVHLLRRENRQGHAHTNLQLQHQRHLEMQQQQQQHQQQQQQQQPNSTNHHMNPHHQHNPHHH